MHPSKPVNLSSQSNQNVYRYLRAALALLFGFAQMQPLAAQQADQVRRVVGSPDAAQPAPAAPQIVPALPVPRLVQFTGTVRDAAGHPRSGMIGLTFSVYKEQVGGATLWMETHNVVLGDDGRYSVLLGGTRSEGMPLDLFAGGEPRWLGVRVELSGEVEEPRVLLVSVPYALKAVDADTLGGRPASAYALADNRAADAAATEVQDPVAATPPARKAAAISPAAVGPISGTGTANQVAKFTGTNSIGNSAITETGGNVGIGTTAPGQKLDVSGSIRASSQLISSVPNGTSPLSVTSTTLVPNLNAGMLGGNQASAFAKLNGSNTFTGNITVTGSVTSAGSIVGTAFTGTSFTGASFTGSGSGLTNVNAATLGGSFATAFARLAASNTFSGAITAPSFNGNGSNLTNVNAVQLGGSPASAFAKLNASNTFAGSITATAFNGNGAGLTNVNAASLGGSPASAFARLSSANVFTGAITAPAFIGDGSGLANVAAASVAGIPAGAIATTAGPNNFNGDQTIAGNLAIVGIGKTLTVGGPSFFNMDVAGGAAGTATCLPIATADCTGYLFNGMAGNTIFKANIDGTQKVVIDDAGNATLAGALSASGVALPASGAATAGSGFSSGPLSLSASAFNAVTGQPVAQTFEWLTQPTGNNSGSPSGQLSLLYGADGNAPAATGLSIGPDGLISFAPGQTFPGGTGITAVNTPAGGGLVGGGTSGAVDLSLLTSCASGQILKWQGTAWACDNDLTGSSGTVTSVGSGLGLVGGPVTTSGSLAIDPAVVPQLGAASNNFAGNVSASSFTGDGSGLTNINAASLNGTPASGYALLAAPNTFTASQNIVGNLNLTGSATVSGYAGSFAGVGGGLLGRDTSPSGVTAGVQGAADSTSGRGVIGSTTSATGNTIGVLGVAASDNAAALFGDATSATGTPVGVKARVASATGTAAIFDNTAGGNILIGQVNGVPKFGVDGMGNVIPDSFATLATDHGTIVHRLAKPTVPGSLGELSSLTVLSTLDTGGALGIVVAKDPSSTNVTLAYFGRPDCDFDGPTTAGDYITISSTLAGGCHDAGPTFPTSGQLIGRTLNSNASSGTYPIALFPPEERAGTGGTGITAVNTAPGSGLMGGATSGAADLSLINTCAPSQVLQWDGTNWGCATITGGGGGSVTSVNTGLGLVGGPITSTGTVAIDTSIVPRLNVSNAFGASQSIAGDLVLTGSANITALGGSFSGAGGGLLGSDTSPTGPTSGVAALAASTNAAAVFAHATALTGVTNGVRGISESSGGVGVLGQAPSTTAGANSIGVQGTSSGENGAAVRGDASGTNSTAVFGNSTAASGFTMAFHGIVRSPSANAMILDNLATTQGGSLILGNYNSTREFSVNTFGDGFFNGNGQFNGSVGIGTTPVPGLPKLTVIGDVRVGTGGGNGCVQNSNGAGIVGTCSSDMRLKKNIQAFSPVLDRLAQLQPVTFEWRADEHPEYGFGSARNSGLIAQDVERVFPEMVATDSRGFKMVNYSELPYLMLQAIKDLKSENDGLKQQNAKLAEALATQQREMREMHIELRRLAAQPAPRTTAAQPNQHSAAPETKDR